MASKSMGKEGECSTTRYPKLLQEAVDEAIKFQQNIYELTSDWNPYKESEDEYLKQYVRYAIFNELGECFIKNPPDPNKPESESQDQKLEAEEQRKKIVELIYSKICETSRSKKLIHVGTIFNVLCIVDKKEDKSKIYPVPIFKVKRCEKRTEASKSSKQIPSKNEKPGRTALYSYCVYYIDSEGRIYKNWTDYVKNNTLPEYTMVLPMGGLYQADPHASNTAEQTYVWTEVCDPPTAKKILPIVDIASTVLGVGALGVGVATLAAPIAAPIVLAGTICGAVSGVYATGRSGQQLVDRHIHQQSISVADRSARSAWLGVAGGLAGGLASGSTFLLNKAVRAGVTLGNVSRTTYNAIGIGNIVINGMGIGNGMYGIYQTYEEKKEFSALEVAQVMAHILFFGNAVINFQTAQTLINNRQQQVLQDYEQSLRSNRHRKAFRRIKRNTQASSGDTTTANSEIIRGIRSIQNKDDFFASVVRNRKVLNKHNAEVTFKDGYATINGNLRVDPVNLAQQPIEVRVSTVSAAEPFNNMAKSALPQTSKMSVSVYNEQISTIKEIIKPIVEVAKTVPAMNPMYIGRLILDMQGFIKDDRDTLIVKLATLALQTVREHRHFITKSLEELMDYIWFRYIRLRVDRYLQELEIDASNIERFPVVAEIVYSITQRIINEIYDTLENFLEEIIDGYSQCSIETNLIVSTVKCSICSGYMLSDS